jgi:hypothetical protein
MLSGDAVLGAVLARVAVFSRHNLFLPAIVGTRQPLNLFVGLVAKPGDGKSCAATLAAELFPIPSRDHDPTNLSKEVCEGVVNMHVPLGTGEGLVHTFFDMTGKQPVQNCFNILMIEDEIGRFKSLGNRGGSTMLPNLRSMWSGAKVGNTTASRGPTVAALAYRASLIMSIQPKHAGWLLNDMGGTPDRFTWFSAYDLATPDVTPNFDPRILWHPFHLADPQVDADFSVDPTVADTIRSLARDRVRGVLDGEYAGHRAQRILRIAAALALLDKRRDITVDDWALARMVDDASEDTLRWMHQQLAERRHTNPTVPESEVNHRSEIHAAKIESIAKLLRDHVPDSGTTRAPLRRSIHSRDRDWFDAAFDHAIANDMLIEDSDGSIRPTDSPLTSGQVDRRPPQEMQATG